MTRFAIVWTGKAQAQLAALDRSLSRRIAARVALLSNDPFRYLGRLVNSPYFRLRVGDWRVIVAVEENIVTVVVLEISHRRSAYR